MPTEPATVHWDPSVPVLTEWVAVLRLAENIEDLDEDAAFLLERAPHHGVVGTVDAHEGMAEHLGVPPRTWFSGVAAQTRTELERALARTARDDPARPLAVGEFRVRRLSD